MENSKHRPRLAMPNPQKGCTENVPMEPKNVSKKRKPRSYLWAFFTKLDERYAECNICKLSLPFKSSISGCMVYGNLSRHYSSKHSSKNQVSKYEKANAYLWSFFTKLDERYSECNFCKLRFAWKTASGASLLINLSKHYSSRHLNKNQDLNASMGRTDAVDFPGMENSEHRAQLAMPNPQTGSTENVPMGSKKVSKKRKARSYLWNSFTKLDGRYAECNICKLRLAWKTGGGASLLGNLSKHYSSKHSITNQSNSVDFNEATAEYEDEDQEIPLPEPPLKKHKSSCPTKSSRTNDFYSRKNPKNSAVRSKFGLKQGFGTRGPYSTSGKRSKLSNARSRPSGQKFKLENDDKNENIAFKTTVELKKLTVQDLVQAKVKPKVIEDYFGSVKLPAKPRSKASKSRVAKAKATPYQVNDNPPMQMIEWKDDNKPQLLNTYDNIKTQGDMIEAMIKDALPTLQSDKVSEIYNFLVDMGVENVEDLAYLEVDDMNKVLKPIQSRKLLAIWKSKGLPSQFQNQTNVPETPATFVPAVFQIQNSENKVFHNQSPENSPRGKVVRSKKVPASRRKNTAEPSAEDIYPEYAAKPTIEPYLVKHETPLPLTAPKDWTDTFEIPWHKLQPEIMKCLSKKKRPNRTERFQIIHTVADDIFKVSKNPTLSQMGKITNEMMRKFPQSLCDEESKKGCKKLVVQLLNRIKYLRRDDGKESDLSDGDEQTEIQDSNSTTKFKSSLSSECGIPPKSSSKPLNSFVTKSTDLAYSARASTTSGEFQIPWHKMPQSLLDTLNKNKPLTKLEKDTLMAIVVDQYILWNPEQKNITATTREIAKRMCEIYPLSLSDKAFGIKGGSQYASAALRGFIHARVYNVRRDFSKKKHPFNASTFCNETSPSSSSDKSVHSARETPTKRSDSQCLSVNDCSSPTRSPRGEFTIRWHKLDKALLDALNKNEPLTPAQSGDLVLAVSEEILRRNPGALTIAKIAEQLCEKYPSSLSNVALGSDDDGNPGSALSSMLRSKLCDLRQTKKLVSRSSSSIDELPEDVSNMEFDSSLRNPTEEEKSSPVRLEFGDFHIPWNKLDPSLLDSLERGKRFSKADKASLVDVVSDELWKLRPKGTNINAYHCGKELAKKLVRLYPKSLSNPALGRPGASDSSSCLSDCFRAKVNKLKRNSSNSKLKARGIQPSVGGHSHQCFCDDCPFGSIDWALNFKIPWEKMPQELQEGLKENDRLSPTLRSELVSIVSRDILKIEESPNKECVDYIAKEMCSMYPKSLCSSSGDDVANEHEFLGREILFRIHRINNDKISVEEENKEKETLDSQKNSLLVGEELVKNTPTTEVAMDVDSNDSTNPASCSSFEDPIYDSSSGALELFPSTNDTSSSTNQDSDNCVKSSVTDANCTDSPKKEGKQVPNDNTKSVVYSENAVPNDNMKSKIYSGNDMKDCDVQSEAYTAAKDGADCSVELVTDPKTPVSDSITKSKIYVEDVSTGCGIKSEAIAAVAVPLCIVQSVTDATKLVLDSDFKRYPDIIKCCDVKDEELSGEEIVDCCEKAVTGLTEPIKNNNIESVTDSTKLVSSNTESVNDLTIGPDNNVKSKQYQDISTVSVVKSPNTKENMTILIKSTVSMKEKNPSINSSINAEFSPATYSDNGVPNSSTNSVTDASNLASNFSTLAAISPASDDFNKRFGTYPSIVVSDCSSKSVTLQTDVVSDGNSKSGMYQHDLVPDCNTRILPSNMNSSYSPSPLAYPVNMASNCTPPIGTANAKLKSTYEYSYAVIQPNTSTPPINTIVQPMQNYSPPMNTVIQPNPMQNYSPSMNTVIQPNPMSYSPVMVPNYNTNPVTCWPPPVMAPNYITQPMAYPSNIAQNCHTNDVIYMGNFGPNCSTSHVAYPLNMNPVVNYSGANTGTYQPAASSSSAYNHGYNMPVQYFQNMSQMVKTEESEPDLRKGQTMQD